jgi:dienelactone hydrolase
MRDDGCVFGEFVGEYTATRLSADPAVVIIGGSEGGWPTQGAALARRLAEDGYSSLALAYFGLAGLPAHLQSVQLEYFADAIAWLAKERQLGPQSLLVAGFSRGSEAAQLIGVHYPELVHHVVAVVPSNLVMGAWPPPAHGPAWTINGNPVPYAARFGPDPVGDQSVVIPVEHIAGRMLVIGAGSDAVWPSGEMAEAIAARRAAHGHAQDVVTVHPHAGHHIDGGELRDSLRAFLDSLGP